MAASLIRLARSAPVKPAVSAATLSRSTSLPTLILRTCTFRMAIRPPLSGRSTSTCRSNRPARSSAGSRISGRLVAASRITPGAGIEAVELGEQLVEGLLLLVVAAERAGSAAAPERVEFVDEDDAGRRLARLLEQIADARRPDADEHLDEFRAGDREERDPGLAGYRAREQGLAGARRPDQQNALGNMRARAGRSSSDPSGRRRLPAARISLRRRRPRRRR